MTSQRDAFGNVTALSYDAGTDVVTAESADGATHSYLHHSAHGLPKQTVDASGNRVEYERNADERLTRVTDRLGGIIEFSWGAKGGKLSTLKNAKGDELRYTYAAQAQIFSNPQNGEQVTFTFDNLLRTDFPDGTAETFGYDESGNMTEWTDQAGNQWRFEYNTRGWLTRLVNPLGGVIDYGMNADGTMASSTDSEIGVTSFEYDQYDRLARVTHPDGSLVTTTYDLNDRVIAMRDENANSWTFTWDANGNLTQVTDPAGGSTQYTYNLMDQLVQILSPRDKQTLLAYDNLLRLASFTDPNGITTTYGYDPRGWINSVRRGGSTWTISLDDEGIPASHATPLGHTLSYQTDSLGYPTTVTDPLNGTTTTSQDSMNRPTSFSDPLQRTVSYSYDTRGLLSKVSMPVIGSANYSYDEMGLLTGIRDLEGQDWTFAYTQMGRSALEQDPLGNTTRYEHDNQGRLQKTTFADSSNLMRSYDPAGNLTGLRYSDGTEIQYTYDALDRLIETDELRLTRNADGRVTGTESQNINFGAAYDDGGRLQTVSYGNGAMTVTYQYDEMTGLLHRVSDDLTGTWIEFEYDGDFRPTEVRRSNGVNTALTWNEANEIVGIQDGNIIDLQYTLDEAGQITAVDMAAPLDPANLISPGTESFSYDAASRVSSSGYTYDAPGRRTAAPARVFDWEADCRLAAVDGVSLTYNGVNDIITRTEGGNTIRYHYNFAIFLHPIVAEQDETGKQFLRYYVWTPGGALLYMIEPSSDNRVSFYHFDRIGSTLALTNAAGEVTDSYAYTPYGSLLGHNGTSVQPFSFLGKWGVRREGPLYHMRGRYYDPITASFLSPEPIWPEIDDPRNLNPYNYALNNPVSLLDRTGLEAKNAMEAAAGAALHANETQGLILF